MQNQYLFLMKQNKLVILAEHHEVYSNRHCQMMTSQMEESVWLSKHFWPQILSFHNQGTWCLLHPHRCWSNTQI